MEHEQDDSSVDRTRRSTTNYHSTGVEAHVNAPIIEPDNRFRNKDCHQDEEPESDPERRHLLTNASSPRSTLPLEDQILEWTNEYNALRHHVHDISHTMGYRLLVTLLLFACELTTFMGTYRDYFQEQAMEDEEDLFTFTSRTLSMTFLLCFVSSATMLVLTLSTMAWLVPICKHRIGPELAILAIYSNTNDSSNHDCGNRSSQQLHSLAMILLTEPVKLHVGLFEMGSEYANGMGLFFLALFLFVFGLKLPGVGGED